MGAWFSTPWFPRCKTVKDRVFDRLEARGHFNLDLAPTAEETFSGDSEDSSEDEEDYSLVEGRQLRSSDRRWAYDESKTVLENRRPALYLSHWVRK